MNIKRGNRLNSIFSLWFLIVAVAPVAVVAYIGQAVERRHVFSATFQELGSVARLKEASLASWAERETTILQDRAFFFADAQSDSSMQALLREMAGVFGSSYYFVSGDGKKIFSSGASLVPEFVENYGTGSYPMVSITPEGGFIALFSAEQSGYIISHTSKADINALLHADINDRKYLTAGRNSPYSIGVGSTADMMLFSENGELLSDSLSESASVITQSMPNELRRWLQGSRKRPEYFHTSLAQRDVLMYARPLTLGSAGYAIVATIDRAEIMSRISAGERNLTLAYIGALILALLILYMFMRSLGGLLVRPIMSSLNALLQSSTKLNDSITTTESIVNAQKDVASNLSKSYRSQVRDIQAVHTEIADIVKSLATVNRQVAIAAESAATVDREALKSKQQAEVAGERLSSIRRLSNAHEVLITALTRYSEEVNTISHDVNQLSQAITYLSLNAGIEATKDENSSKSISALVSEVGKLARMSREASMRINSVVEAMQRELHGNKEAAAHERLEAERGVTVITSALQTLRAISQSALQIAKSVRSVNAQVSKQFDSAEGIVRHSKVIAENAQETFRDANRIARLAAEQKVSVASNISVVKKMSASIEQLSRLVGSKNKSKKI